MNFRLRRYHFGEAPEVILAGDPNIRFTYVPGHLHYILTELLKNSLRATMERYSDGLHPPPVRVIIARGENDVTIKVKYAFSFFRLLLTLLIAENAYV